MYKIRLKVPEIKKIWYIELSEGANIKDTRVLKIELAKQLKKQYRRLGDVHFLVLKDNQVIKEFSKRAVWAY